MVQKLTQKSEALVREAIRAAEMGRANFNDIVQGLNATVVLRTPDGHETHTGMTADEFIKDRTRPYRTSGIIYPLKKLLGEED